MIDFIWEYIRKKSNLQDKQYDKSKQADYPKPIFVAFVVIVLPFQIQKDK